MLKDYPEHIQELQRSLNRVVAKPFLATPLFEQAIWALEGALESFIDETRDELEAAEASGDAAAIERARAKDFLMGCARHQGIYDVDDLWNYFQANGGTFG
jgi:hypothetical protein